MKLAAKFFINNRISPQPSNAEPPLGAWVGLTRWVRAGSESALTLSPGTGTHLSDRVFGQFPCETVRPRQALNRR